MASEFGFQTAKKLSGMVSAPYHEWWANIIDAELTEVRDALDWLLESKGAYLFHEDECPWQYGPDESCNCRVQRARALYEKLEIR